MLHKGLNPLKVIIIVSLLALLVGCGPKAANLDYLKGKTDFQHQNYYSSFKTLMKSAKKGNLNAEYAVGYSYYYGLGTSKNLLLAKYWLSKSAKKGNEKAIQALETIFNGQQHDQ